MSAQTRSIVAWIIVGLVAGWVASLIHESAGTATLEWLIAGLIGAVVGGFTGLLKMLGGRVISRFQRKRKKRKK